MGARGRDVVCRTCVAQGRQAVMIARLFVVEMRECGPAAVGNKSGINGVRGGVLGARSASSPIYDHTTTRSHDDTIDGVVTSRVCARLAHIILWPLAWIIFCQKWLISEVRSTKYLTSSPDHEQIGRQPLWSTTTVVLIVLTVVNK